MPVRPGLCSVTLRALPWEDVLEVAVVAELTRIEWGADIHVPPGDETHARTVADRCAVWLDQLKADQPACVDFKVPPAGTGVGLTEAPRGSMTRGGVAPAIIGTLYLTIGAVLFALPLGLATALYLCEYSPKGFAVNIVRMSINNLAGVPSVDTPMTTLKTSTFINAEISGLMINQSGPRIVCW